MSETIAVVVPSYRRPELLGRCLAALARQTRAADEIVVVLRSEDRESRRVTEEQRSPVVTVVEVDRPGVIAAMRAGVGRSSSTVVAFTDDDAEPNRDWLERLLALMAGPRVGAAGGRDVIPGQTEPRREIVGQRTRHGKLVGNHHLGVGAVRDVDVLKGVNMAFRAECLALPAPGILRGDGAEVHFELLCSRWAQKLGWRVVYDPTVEVAHVGAERVGLDRRANPAPTAIEAASYNFLVATTALDRRLLPVQALYTLALGSRGEPGLGRALLALARGERVVTRRFLPSLKGSILATARLAAGIPGPVMIICDEMRAGATSQASAA